MPVSYRIAPLESKHASECSFRFRVLVKGEKSRAELLPAVQREESVLREVCEEPPEDPDGAFVLLSRYVDPANVVLRYEDGGVEREGPLEAGKCLLDVAFVEGLVILGDAVDHVLLEAVL